MDSGCLLNWKIGKYAILILLINFYTAIILVFKIGTPLITNLQ